MQQSPVLEKIMRFAVPACALSLLLAATSSVSYSKRDASVAVNPRSSALSDQATRDIAANNLEVASDTLESALIIDPRNRAAYVALAQIALKQDLPGKAIRLYREALTIDPNDLDALAGQGEAMVQKGAVTKAKENLSRIEQLCKARCAQYQRLSAAIAKGAPPPPKAIASEAVKPMPVVTEMPAKPETATPQ